MARESREQLYDPHTRGWGPGRIGTVVRTGTIVAHKIVGYTCGAAGGQTARVDSLDQQKMESVSEEQIKRTSALEIST